MITDAVQAVVGVSDGKQLPKPIDGPMKEMAQLPALLLPPNRREELLACLRSSLGTEEFERVRVVFEGAAQSLEAMEQKRLSIDPLRNVIFGAKAETGQKMCKPPPKDPKRQG